MNRLPSRLRSGLLVVVAAFALVGCSHHKALGPSPYKVFTTTTLPPPKLGVGQGFLQLSGRYYPFTVASCLTGPAKTDDVNSSRVFGVYANGYTDGQLFAVEITEYTSGGGPKGVPATTQSVLVRMLGKDKGKTIGLGLRAQRYQATGQTNWVDVLDPGSQDKLIKRDGERYVARARFGPDDAQAGDPGILDGLTEAVCPRPGTTTVAPATSLPAAPSSSS